MAAAAPEGGADGWREPRFGRAAEAPRRPGGVRRGAQLPGKGQCTPRWGGGATVRGGDFSWCERLTCSPQVRTETMVDLNVQHEQKSKAAAEEHGKNLEGN